VPGLPSWWTYEVGQGQGLGEKCRIRSSDRLGCQGGTVRIILNSDVLYGDFSSHGLPREVQRLAGACGPAGHNIVLPLTTVLEMKHRQDELVHDARLRLTQARSVLSLQGIHVGDFDVTDVVRDVDAVALFKQLLSTTEVVPPTLEDYEDAHRRASLREAPHPEKIKSDEMRDLVIWAIAVRLSREDGRAILLSKDEVHVNSLGHEESAQVGLVRLGSVQEALEYMEVSTPAGELMEGMLSSWWDELRAEGLPIGLHPSLRTVSNVQFVQGRSGPAQANGFIKMKGDKEVSITADVEVRLPENAETSLSLTNIFIDKTPHASINVTHQKSVAETSVDYEERMQSLRDILGGNG
jgi:hypothetical protein